MPEDIKKQPRQYNGGWESSLKSNINLWIKKSKKNQTLLLQHGSTAGNILDKDERESRCYMEAPLVLIRIGVCNGFCFILCSLHEAVMKLMFVLIAMGSKVLIRI